MKRLLSINVFALLLTIGIAQPINNEVFSEVEPLIAAGGISTPLDAAPDSTGENVYFIATGTNGIGVFQVPMQGGTVTEIKAGEPFTRLEGLALSPDGKWVFVADSEAQGGVIFRLSLEDNSVTVLAGEGTAPKGLEVVGNQLYFTGTEDSEPAVFSIPVTGGERVTLAKGAPFANLSSVAATEEGVVYVSDRGLGDNRGVIYRIDSSVTPIAQNLILGNPAGIALTADASVLAVSSLSADGHAQVILINTASLETLLFNRVIGENVSAGGLHRSPGGSAEVFAWVDTEGDNVYKVKRPKAEAQPTGF
jgi:DNA-binding beta-propeller fold protein YncE